MKRDLIVAGLVLSLMFLFVGLRNGKTDMLLLACSILNFAGWTWFYIDIKYRIKKD